MVGQQLSGCNAVLFFSVPIFSAGWYKNISVELDFSIVPLMVMIFLLFSKYWAQPFSLQHSFEHRSSRGHVSGNPHH